MEKAVGKWRKIIHVDMDAFYASVEIRDNPKLQGKPVIVGTRVVTTCNYEARKYGLNARRRIPNRPKWKHTVFR